MRVSGRGRLLRFRDPGGTLCPVNSHLGPRLRQVKTPSGKQARGLKVDPFFFLPARRCACGLGRRRGVLQSPGTSHPEERPLHHGPRSSQRPQALPISTVGRGVQKIRKPVPAPQATGTPPGWEGLGRLLGSGGSRGGVWGGEWPGAQVSLVPLEPLRATQGDHRPTGPSSPREAQVSSACSQECQLFWRICFCPWAGRLHPASRDSGTSDHPAPTAPCAGNAAASCQRRMLRLPVKWSGPPCRRAPRGFRGGAEAARTPGQACRRAAGVFRPCACPASR
ncbi:uncharacterized protein LOC122706907 isoform X1 [Cervus elaphus]|uniref:uncharacterized protein LOC122706907 isoform X1 n=1 Tax=Cervus elaphus TaxID=9860 RepID=UPI001CC2E718|nr:uncharacterized protein LOC122706907 isoform X1 [Cervus elaphus]